MWHLLHRNMEAKHVLATPKVWNSAPFPVRPGTKLKDHRSGSVLHRVGTDIQRFVLVRSWCLSINSRIDYKQLSLHMAFQFKNGFCCIKHCWNVQEQKSIANSLGVDDWTAELAIIACVGLPVNTFVCITHKCIYRVTDIYDLEFG